MVLLLCLQGWLYNVSFVEEGSNIVWKRFEEKDDSNLPFMQQEVVDYCTPHDKVSMVIIIQTLKFYVFTEGEIWATMKDVSKS